MKRVLLQLALFCALVFLLQVAAFTVSPKTPHSLPVRELKAALQSQDGGIVFLGDSVMASCAPSDQSRRAIPQMLQTRLPGHLIIGVHHGGYHMRLFDDFCHYILHAPHHPRAVIVEINLAGFEYLKSPYSLKDVSADLYRDQHRLFDLFFTPLSIFRPPWLRPDTTMARYLNQTVYRENVPVGKVRDFEANSQSYNIQSEENLRKKITLRYLGPLTPRNPYVKAALHIADQLKAQGIEPLFYITPMNDQVCERGMPGDFRRIMRQKTALLKSLLAQRNVATLDLSEALGPEFFHQTIYPNEHLTDRGRRYVADQLAAYVRHKLGAAPP
jgi:hypothetical protein